MAIVVGAPALASGPQTNRRSRGRAPAVQTATVELTDDGYKPATLTLRKGVLARVTFVRRIADTCGTAIAVPEFGIHRDLPFNEPVVVEFTPAKTGTFKFTCGMDMLRGSLVVR